VVVGAARRHQSEVGGEGGQVGQVRCQRVTDPGEVRRSGRPGLLEPRLSAGA
jgi:hypothetical protein